MYDTVLVKKYAAAFLHVFVDSIDRRVADASAAFALYMNAHKRDFFYLSLSTITPVMRAQLLAYKAEQHALPSFFFSLFSLLSLHKRLSATPFVLRAIKDLYLKNNAIVPCTITTSHQVTPEEFSILCDSMHRHLMATIEGTHQIDHDLIAGVRLCGGYLLWEQSINKQLRTLEIAFKEKYGK